MNKINPVNDWVRGGSPGLRLSSIQLDTMLRKASEARVDTRLRRYYLIVLLLPENIYSSLSSFEFDMV